MSDISLNAGIRSNLLSMQRTESLFNRTTERLGTGKKVNSAIDNPTNFFAAVNLNDRASGLNARLDGMGDAVQQIKAADNGITAIRSLLSSMKGIINNAMSQTDSDARAALGVQFNELISQIATVAEDSSFGGVNLLSGAETRTVQFNEEFGESTLLVAGSDVESGATAAGGLVGGVVGASSVSILLTLGNAETAGFKSHVTAPGQLHGIEFGVTGAAANTALAGLISDVEKFEQSLLTQAGSLANNLTIITIREDFTSEMINTLQEGADKLTLADLNEEGANLLALQTASALATQSLALGSQQSQQVLQLLG